MNASGKFRSAWPFRPNSKSAGCIAALLLLCAALAYPASGEIVGRYVFYNNSAFDNYNPGVDSDDSAAIAIDKEALLAGQTAVYANYTSYSRGINGIAIDVNGLNGIPTASDFEFRAGNDNKPSTWPTVGNPQIDLLPGAGVDGSGRVFLTWPDNSIENQWLQVRILPTPITGLPVPDVFYFGNSIGESGNSQTDAWVTPIDSLMVINYLNAHGSHEVDIDFAYDHNRDGWISPSDSLIVINSLNSGSASTLGLITVPAPLGTTLPSDRDAWTEYPTGILALADGWYNTCGLSQQIVASEDSVAGSFSVGCRATQSRWDKPFQFEKSADISRASELKFQHRDSWSDRSVQLRIYMEPTPAEAGIGIVEKKVVFDYYTSDSWTEFSGVLGNGIWSWKDESENWFTFSGNTQPTTLLRIEWFHMAFPWITPVVIGDEMLIDGMYFMLTTPDSSFDMGDLTVFASQWLHDDCGPINNFCEGADTDGNGRVDFVDYSDLSSD